MPRMMQKGSNDKAKDFVGSIKRLLKELSIFKVLLIISISLAFWCSILSIIAPNRLSTLVDEISKGLIINTDNLDELNNAIKDNFANIVISKNSMKDTTYEEVKEKQSDEIISYYYNNLDLLKEMLPSIIIDGVTLTAQDQIDYLKLFSTIKENETVNFASNIKNLPENVQKIIEPKINMKNVKKYAIILLTIYAISSLFAFGEDYCMTIASNKFANSLRRRMSNKINKLPLKYFDKTQIGDVLSTVTNDIDIISQSMDSSLANLVSALALFIGTTIMMFITNYLMALTAILSSLFGFFFMSRVLAKSQKYHIQRQEYLGEINGHIEEIYSGYKVVKVYNAAEEVNKKFDEINEKLYEANRKGQFLSSLMMPMMGFVGDFGYVAVCIVGALLVMNGKITFGVIIAFITYVRLFTQPLTKIGQSMNSLQMMAASSERVFEFLDEEEMNDQSNIVRKLLTNVVVGNIEFKNVEFTYDGNTKPTIKNFSAKVKAGQKIAIVGPTGAGKTTMVNLLMKFYEINKGDIVIDGVSIKELSRENIHSLFTMVLQDTWLFDGTIKENIIYNRKNITDEKVKSVCKTVGLDHFIKTLPKTYNSKISDNDSVSAGQRQLLTIARGMIEDAPFLILDEATSNVDTRTEELVQKAMDKLMENRTSFIIAHRLSTIKNADLILVMKDGNIVEQGSHNKLMKEKGFYYDLYNSQFDL